MAVVHEIRTKDGGLEQVVLTPLRAIRRHCLECCGWQWSLVRTCTSKNCPVFPYRMGHRPEEPEAEDGADDGSEA